MREPPEKAPVGAKKEVRGVVGNARRAAVAAAAKKTYTEAGKKACSIEAMKNGEICEACQ